MGDRILSLSEKDGTGEDAGRVPCTLSLAPCPGTGENTAGAAPGCVTGGWAEGAHDLVSQDSVPMPPYRPQKTGFGSL